MTSNEMNNTTFYALHLTKDNFDRLIKQGLTKISKPTQPNRDGEGILNGLGLWVPGMLDYSHSPFAKSIIKMLKTHH